LVEYLKWPLSDWYVCWVSSGRGKSEERLLVWPRHRWVFPEYSYDEVKEMLSSGDFSRVVGFREEEDLEVLRRVFEEWIRDVDRSYEVMEK